MVKHAWEEHEGMKPEVIMRIISKHESPMDRQVTEAVRISRLFNGDDKENMNAKAEWGIPRTSTLGVTLWRDGGRPRTKEGETKETHEGEKRKKEHVMGRRKSD